MGMFDRCVMQIIDCHDVAAADLTGTSDVYVTVTWRERFMGATRVKVGEDICHVALGPLPTP